MRKRRDWAQEDLRRSSALLKSGSATRQTVDQEETALRSAEAKVAAATAALAIGQAPSDPMKQVLRSYFPMQEEKDNRVYGALDAALRGDMFRNVEPRWVEWMKLFLAIIPFPEISAARSMAMVARLAPGEDLRTGFTMQMVDEFRPGESTERVMRRCRRRGRFRPRRRLCVACAGSLWLCRF